MNLAIDLNGTEGNVILLAYIVGGILLFVTSLLPGSSTGWRIFGMVAGLGVALWSAYVLLFGGWIIVNFYILLLPIILAVRAIVAAVKSRKQTSSTFAPSAPPAE
jgi:hypothetical protein